MNEAYSDEQKTKAAAWFEKLRDDLCATLEAIEDDVEGPNVSSQGEPGRFEPTAWERAAFEDAESHGGGGVRPQSATRAIWAVNFTNKLAQLSSECHRFSSGFCERGIESFVLKLKYRLFSSRLDGIPEVAGAIE